MGTRVEHAYFSDQDLSRFRRQLQVDLEALQCVLERPGFGQGPTSLGFELELSLVGADGKPCWINTLLQQEAKDEQLTLELNRYNLEYNLSPVPAKGRPFSAMAAEMTAKLKCLTALAHTHQAIPVMIGILPSVSKRDISLDATTDDLRYQALARQIYQMHGKRFDIVIDGPEPLNVQLNDINAEGANTSFQVHLRVPPPEFVNIYNAAQLLIGPLLAVASNSPLFLQHRLWEETRIPMFKQAVETRTPKEKAQGLMSRTGMGKCWLKHSVFDLFEQSVNEFDPLLPECVVEDSLSIVKGDGMPNLAALRLHHGSIWHWNRAIFDPSGDGHLRIEMRCLPSGPSVVDMAANAALMVGAAAALAPQMPTISASLPPELCKYNCYRAAQYGMDAELFWPKLNGHEFSRVPTSLILNQLLERAAQGLAELAVDRQESQQYLQIIRDRIAARMTGARWQLKRLQQLEKVYERLEAIRIMQAQYIENSRRNTPVHEWAL